MRRFVELWFLLVIVVGVGLSACDDPEAPFTRPSISVRISPDEIAMCEGEKTKLTAAVIGGSNLVVRWRSNSPGIATVDSVGDVTAIAAGDVWVSAVAVADTMARDSVNVRVAPLVLLYNDVIVVSISSITQHNTATPIDTSNVSGVIDVRFDYDMPRCIRGVSARVRLNDQLVCNQGVVENRGRLLCVVNTAELDAAAQRRFPNGVARLRADLAGSNGVVVASNTSVPFTIRN